MRAMFLVVLASVLLSGGCAKYNYDITQPESARLRVGKQWQRVAAGPVTYRMITVDNHLVIQCYNTTKDPMRVLGDRSYIVTPANQSIPLPSQTIAPGSYAKLILPPLEQIVRPGPSIGFGAGYSTGRYYGHRAFRDPFYDPWFPEPTYLYIENPSTYWQWEGESDATVHLVFEHSAGTLEQTFVFHRVKV